MHHRDDHPAVKRVPRAGVPIRVRNVLVLAVLLLVVPTVAGVVVLWPSGAPNQQGRVDLGPVSFRGTVIDVGATACPESPAGLGPSDDCRFLRVKLRSGPDKGATVRVVEEGASDVGPGDRVVLTRTPGAPSAEREYTLSDVDRSLPLLVLVGIFVLVVVALGRWRGALALMGFALSLVVLVLFVLPAILAGENPVAVAVTGSSVVMLLALYLAHGVNTRTTAAVLGTLASLALTALLALLFVEAARLTGFTSDEAIFLSATAGGINLRGLLLAGMVIGTLGVLDDVTVTQASTVWELRRANPSMGPGALYRSALRVGRDHIASTVNTLVLAYAGAALPLLVFFTLAGAHFGNALNGEVVAEEVIRTLVGSIGLIASVPITTALAALIASKTLDASSVADGALTHDPVGHSHAHAYQGVSPGTDRRLLRAVIPFATLTLVGLVLLWPRARTEPPPGVSLPGHLLEAVVGKVTPVPCAPGLALTEEAGEPCKSLDVRFTAGPGKGTAAVVLFSDDRPTRPVRVGDKILLEEVRNAPAERRWSFSQFQRRGPMALLALLFAGAVLWLGRRQGLRALVGLVVSILLLSWFVLPAILAGRNPTAVAVVGSSALMLVALYFSHGLNARTSTAVLGTLASLVFTVILALVFVRWSALSGFAAEGAEVVAATADAISLKGLLLAGIIIGALGVLDDVTITQASAVWELRHANPSLGAGDLYRSAVRVGRDHIASTVNTLVLAYVGASLPLMLLFVLADTSPGDVLNGEPVAQEVVRTLVGSIGLVVAVPITTRLAALVAAKRVTD
jgi:uncharacterized membrane protein